MYFLTGKSQTTIFPVLVHLHGQIHHMSGRFQGCQLKTKLLEIWNSLLFFPQVPYVQYFSAQWTVQKQKICLVYRMLMIRGKVAPNFLVSGVTHTYIWEYDCWLLQHYCHIFPECWYISYLFHHLYVCLFALYFQISKKMLLSIVVCMGKFGSPDNPWV